MTMGKMMRSKMMRKTAAMRNIMKVTRKKRLAVNMSVVMMNCTLKMVLN